ncbi:hypothetical protein BDC45DRAFT_589189 [Circinella umbellata]|nr:hypothetical protein BDC45DRAFT_589189 [Circinella umbellata]
MGDRRNPLKAKCQTLIYKSSQETVTLILKITKMDIMTQKTNPMGLYVNVLILLPRLPYEVVDIILSELSTAELFECLEISAKMIYNGCQEMLDESVAEILCGIMNSLKSLDKSWDCSDFIGNDVLNCIGHLQNSLTELEIVYTLDTRYVLPFDMPNLSSILHACRLEVSLHDSNITQYSDEQDRSTR